VLHRHFYFDVFNELQKRSRIVSTIESRITNVGLGIPRNENVEDLFRFPSGLSLLNSWTDAVEILSSKDIPVPFQVISGENIARGEQMRVLSTYITTPRVRIIPASTEWGPRETLSVNIRKPQNEYFIFNIVPGELSSWITTPSFGRPVIIKSIDATYGSSSGSALLQNPLYVSKDWYGIDMFHSFRVSYFHVEAETFYIRDTDKIDTTNAVPSTRLHIEPVVDDILSSCFELNKTTKTLSCWFLILSRSPTTKPGIPGAWPSWAITQPNASSKKMRVIHHSWRLINL
jgi:hypothetical protein